ncbi:MULTISPECIES: ABC transporter permease [unclassified Phycicoccus]|uniref:ABC transporter permease n=1 Tax=unclassified Phycicoccus TaxID=2637926 RepID=UPI00070244C4|nr:MULTISPECIES: ABC transporter permease [unclassified Phycicoccus]KQU65186.1 ABC transporter permease [Phycicoccus sp. Root101]KQZ89686.1 ABC transporter permease [Phycicoccus sp. Root563]
MIPNILGWLFDPAHWSGSDGIASRIVEHLWYSALAMVLACLIAIPAGLAIGHTGRGRFLAVNLAGAARAIPSLGLLYLMVLWLFPKLAGDSAFLVPAIIVLVVLAIPPIMAGAYSGVEGVDPGARDAAKGMGMTGMQVLRQVEVPCALPLIFSGVRSAILQVIATATLAAVAGTGGLGRFIIDGQKVHEFAQMASGAILVAVLALVIDLLMSLVQRSVVSPGLGAGPATSGRAGRRSRTAPSGNTPVDVEIDSSGRTVDAPAR